MLQDDDRLTKRITPDLWPVSVCHRQTKVGMGISSLDLTSAVRLRVFLHRRHIHSTFFILLFQAWAWTGSSIHPFLKRTNSPDQKEGVITDFQTNVSHNSSSAHRPIVFGQNWATAFANDNLGCQSGRGSFMWRGQGFGSNINSEFVFGQSSIYYCMSYPPSFGIKRAVWWCWLYRRTKWICFGFSN